MITFRAIRPTAFNLKALEAQIRQAQRDWMAEVSQEFLKTTKNWEHKVVFVGRMAERGVTTTIEVSTEDDIYRYVDEGTRPHRIRAKGAKVLAFPSSFIPKTRPGSLISGKGKRGEVDTFRKEVQHPGTEARDFSGQIKKKMEPLFEKAMQKALNSGAAKSGHAM